MNKPLACDLQSSRAKDSGEGATGPIGRVRLAELAAIGRAEPAGEDAILAEVEALEAEDILIERTRP